MCAKLYPDLPRNRTVEIAPGVQMEFVLVLPGVFVMGDAKYGYSRERPEHLIRITQSYYLGRYPVTQAQWKAVTGNNPAEFKGDDLRPMESISWEDIVRSEEVAPGFMARLSAVPGYAYRLPTEAEWEYAARGGHLAPPLEMISGETQIQSDNLYPTYTGGEDVNAAAWQNQNNGYSTLRTGYRQPNALGLYSMSGNVFEWCQDTFEWEAYAKRFKKDREVIDPLEEGPGPFRVVRGGFWGPDPGRCLPAHRASWSPSGRYRSCGFRLVLAPDSGQQKK